MFVSFFIIAPTTAHDCTLLETNVSQTYSNLLILDLFVKFKDHSPEEIDGDIRMSGFVRNSKRLKGFPVSAVKWLTLSLTSKKIN